MQVLSLLPETALVGLVSFGTNVMGELPPFRCAVWGRIGVFPCPCSLGFPSAG